MLFSHVSEINESNDISSEEAEIENSDKIIHVLEEEPEIENQNETNLDDEFENKLELDSVEEDSEEKIVHILDDMEEVEEDINFDIEDEISALNTSETNQINIDSFEDDSKEEIDNHTESSSIEWSLFDDKEKKHFLFVCPEGYYCNRDDVSKEKPG